MIHLKDPITRKRVAELNSGLRWEAENDDTQTALQSLTTEFVESNSMSSIADPMYAVAEWCGMEFGLNVDASEHKEPKEHPGRVY